MKPSSRELCGMTVLLLANVAFGHDIITTKITWDREISRIVYSRCANCHRPNGPAFSLMTYSEARPWAKAIQEEVLERRMPPWGAVKGFAEYKDDQALTPEQLELIAQWVDGGAPEGEEKDLPPVPKIQDPPQSKLPPGLPVTGEMTLRRDLLLDGIAPERIPEKSTFQLFAQLPDGRIEPLLWLLPFKPAYAHPFMFKNPITLPKGTRITGLPEGVKVVFIPGQSHTQGSGTVVPNSGR